MDGQNVKFVMSNVCHVQWPAVISTPVGRKKIKERTKISYSIVDHFSLIFVNLSLAWMLYFHVWLQNKGKFLVWSEYYNQFGIYQRSHASLLETRQSNLSNPEVYSEPCQMSNLICYSLFGKIHDWESIQDWFSCNISFLILKLNIITTNDWNLTNFN